MTSSEFQRVPAYRGSQVGAGGTSAVVSWRVDHGYLPGFTPHREGSMVASNNVASGLPSQTLWEGGWMDAAKALARELADKEDDSAAFAVLEQAELWNHCGNFKPVNDGWLCFDYPFYLVVRKKQRGYTAHLMRRLY